MKLVRLYLIISGIILLTSIGFYIWVPTFRGYLLDEDSLIENISAILYLVSFFIGLFFFLKHERHRKALTAVSAISLLGFLDELSFGERHLGINGPLFYDVQIDGAHDFFYLAYKMALKTDFLYSIYGILLLLTGILIITALLLKHRLKLKKLFTRIHNEAPLLFLLFFGILIFIALIIDLGIIESKFLFMIEELFEMLAALALLFCNLSIQAFPIFQTLSPYNANYGRKT